MTIRRTEFEMLEHEIVGGVSLLRKHVSIDDGTSLPTIEIKIKIPIELMRDGLSCFGENEFYRILGKAVMNCNKNNEVSTVTKEN